MKKHLFVSSAILITLLSSPLYAQFDNLVTSDDGSTILFQSRWRLKGSSSGSLNKIFRWDSKGFTSVATPPDTGLVTPPSVTNPMIGGDGAITGYLNFPGCSLASCTDVGYAPVLIGATLASTLPPAATAQLSRNSRYFAFGNTVVDRNTGTATTAFPDGLPIGGRFGIGNNGGLLYVLLRGIPKFSTVDLLLSNRPGVIIANAQFIATAVISASENRVVYEIRSVSNRQLWSFDTNSGLSTLLEEFNFNTNQSSSQFQPSISNDGSRILYRRINTVTQISEAVVRDFNTNTTIVLGAILDSSNNFTITGNGSLAWLHLAGGELVRTPINTLGPTLTAGRHAWVSQREGAPVPGSYNHLFGGGFASNT